MTPGGIMIPDGATRITLDVIDVIISEIIKGDGTQCFAKTEALQYFFSTLSAEDNKSKEVHFMLTSILSAVESFDPYDLTFEDSKPSAESSDSALEDPTPLVWWSCEQWEVLYEMIWNLMQKLGAEESSTLKCVLDSIHLNQALACIRSVVEEQLVKKSSGPVVIECILVSKFVKKVHDVGKGDIRGELERVLIAAEGNRNTRSHQKIDQVATLKPIQDLKAVLKSDPFHFSFFQRKIRKLIGEWAVEHVPSLRKYLGYESATQKNKKKNKRRYIVGDEEEEEFSDVPQKDDGFNIEEPVETPRKKAPRVLHELTGDAGGVQILDDEEEKDGEYAQSPVNSPRRKRKKRINFTQEEKDAIKEAVAALDGTTPNWRLIKHKFPVLGTRTIGTIRNCYKTLLQNGSIGNDDEDSPGRRSRQNPALPAEPRGWRGRKSWTPIELAAVRAGVRKHKVGAWAVIKADDDYNEALRNRTSVQIKDAYRVLCKRNDG